MYAVEEINTKIIATIGPATLDFGIFQKLVDSGIDYIRINTAYGDENQYSTILDNLNKANKHKAVKAIFDLKTEQYIPFALKHDVYMYALSFSENKEQISKMRNLLPESFLISKIESKKGVENFDEILSASDGIMIARGDLGVAESLEKVPPMQKDFTNKAKVKDKFLITATEMLLSMVDNPEPTRAEVSDVANAVFDSSSAVMLSEETAIGKYPVETVIMMRKIIVEAEKWQYSHQY
jgi:pyruvate kinase